MEIPTRPGYYQALHNPPFYPLGVSQLFNMKEVVYWKVMLCVFECIDRYFILVAFYSSDKQENYNRVEDFIPLNTVFTISPFLTSPVLARCCAFSSSSSGSGAAEVILGLKLKKVLDVH